MSIPIATASPWPARAAYISAAIFSAASGITNLNYGWSKGSDPASSLVWACVAGAVAIVFALSWPAMIKSLDAKRWSAAVIALMALVLSGSYSITAALGSASGGRTNAATAETATTDARTKAQAAYDRAEAELSKLAAARPVAEIEALLMGAQWWRPPKGCTADKVAQRVTCPTMEAELARSRQRDKLKAEMDRASAELARVQPAKVANSDAKALARYLSAAGLDIGPDRLSDLLVLLAVLTIEAGGGLSLALGMALDSTTVVGQAKRAADGAADHDGQPEKPLAATLVGQERHSGQRAATVADHREPLRPPTPVTMAQLIEPDIVRCLRAAGGKIESLRRLADQIGRSRSAITAEVHRLAAAGVVALARGRHGTVVSLGAVARPN
jgi:biotin operon repressor